MPAVCGWGRVLSAAVTELLALFDVPGVFGRVLFDDPGVPGWELEVFLGGDAGLQLPSAFNFGVQFGTEEQCQVGDPQPEQEDDDAGEGAVGLVVVRELGYVGAEQGGSDGPGDDGDDGAEADPI